MNMKCIFKISSVVLAGLSVGVGIFVYTGAYNVAADDHHTRPVSALLQVVRERAITARARDLAVPSNLGNPELVLKGAGQYAAMCEDCHLKPGKNNSEIRVGLYPHPPDLAHNRIAPGHAFWVIKHGIKMTAMPAWGLNHDDDTIWSIVAFLQILPKLSPDQYRDLVKRAPPDEEMKMGS